MIGRCRQDPSHANRSAASAVPRLFALEVRLFALTSVNFDSVVDELYQNLRFIRQKKEAEVLFLLAFDHVQNYIPSLIERSVS